MNEIITLLLTDWDQSLLLLGNAGCSIVRMGKEQEPIVSFKGEWMFKRKEGISMRTRLRIKHGQ